MAHAYPTRYRDAQGELATALFNDGKTLSMELGGVRFEGPDFDSLTVASPEGAAVPARFTLSSCGDLCACVLELELPVTVASPRGEEEGGLEVRLVLGAPSPNGGIDAEQLALALRLKDRRLRSPGTSGWFEDELASLQRQLRDGVHLKCCFGCAFSDYSPAGHALFGSLGCFRRNKAGYAAAKTKEALFALWAADAESVQETDLCPEFDRRVPGTGYRG
ncbi:MAG: DUF6304 family protein [Myxococcales bacterium]